MDEYFAVFDHGLRQDSSGRQAAAGVGLAPWARLKAWLWAWALDRRLAAGTDPGTSKTLMVRAAKLASPRYRRSLAGALEAAARAADDEVAAFTAAVPLARVEVREACLVFAALVERLRWELPVEPRGVAMARMLLVDAASPLYGNGEPGQLERAVRAATDALEPRP
jgi:hypothetical protein